MFNKIFSKFFYYFSKTEQNFINKPKQTLFFSSFVCNCCVLFEIKNELLKIYI